MQKAIKISGNNKLFDNNIDLVEISKDADKFNGADLAEIIRRALEEKISEKIRGQDLLTVSTDDILNQVNTYEHLPDIDK
jgi:SpoVK/Ycf46/Vps4 family AAA+-type ATPase